MSASRGDLEAAAGATPAPAVGFHAQLDASLWDLVQMECLARSRLCVEVAGEAGTGYLYFDGGRVVHAATERRRGEAAALEILGWTQGTFRASARSWPPGGPSIEMTHEELLLRAAKRRDDERASNLVAFPARGGGAPADGALEAGDDLELLELDQPEEPTEPKAEAGGTTMRTPGNTNVDEATHADAPADFPVMLRLSASGAVLRNKGGSEQLAEAAAYAHRLVQLTGDLLGLEEFVALECAFTEGRCLVFGEGGDVVVLRPRADLNLQSLRERLGL
jgi:hypothetical protein